MKAGDCQQLMAALHQPHPVTLPAGNDLGHFLMEAARTKPEALEGILLSLEARGVALSDLGFGLAMGATLAVLFNEDSAVNALAVHLPPGHLNEVAAMVMRGKTEGGTPPFLPNAATDTLGPWLTLANMERWRGFYTGLMPLTDAALGKARMETLLPPAPTSSRFPRL
jgi:hypothetical protein